MHSLRILIASTALTLFVTSTHLLAGTPSATLKSFKFNGSGCKSGGQASISEDSSTIELQLAADLTASTGKGVGRRSARGSCNVILELEHAKGYQFNPESLDFTYKADLAANTEGLIKLRKHFQGSSTTGSGEKTFKGPLKTSGQDTLKLQEEWSGCTATRALVLNISPRLVKGHNLPTTSTLTLSSPARLKLDWRPCSK